MRPQDVEQLFLDNLPLVDRLLAATRRRHRLTKEQGEDFASVGKLKLVANDYELLRAFEGRSALATFLAAVIQRAYMDHCNHLWGKWRPSNAARRLGPLAVRLDTLLHRDGRSLGEACALIPEEDREEAHRLASQLPSRARRRFTGDEELGELPSAEASPEAVLVQRERELAAERVHQALENALEKLSAEDRLLVRLRIYEGVPLASAARSFGEDARQLYRRWETVKRSLRRTLEEGGYDAARVGSILGGGGDVDLRASPSHQEERAG
jgi:RNA polymerase sigma factor for flagellar operon FliA